MRLARTFQMKMYDCALKFIVCPDIGKEIVTIEKRRPGYSVSFKGEAGGLAFSWTHHEYFILISENALRHSYIAHEILHTVEKISKDRGIKDEEAKAYLCGYITRLIYEFLSSKKRKIDNG